MLYDLDYEFIFKGNDYFDKEEKETKRDGSSYIESIIVYFYKEDNTIKHFIRKSDTDIKDINFKENDIICKYYIKKLSYYSVLDIDTVINIYNIGDFKITNEFVNKKTDMESKELFDKYDKEYHNMTFPFTDDEFLEKNYKELLKEFKEDESIREFEADEPRGNEAL
jgi:hypothetical protein